MLIRINDISPQGLAVNDVISATALNARMAEGRGNDIKFLSDPPVTLYAHPTPGGARVEGSIQASYQQPCALCADEREYKLEVAIDFILKQQKNRGLGDPGADDIGIIFYEGDQVELENILQEFLILGLSPFKQPEFDGNGRCRDCHHSREEILGPQQSSKPTLGELLAQAGLKHGK